MVIADYLDHSYDSAVFLEGGSFNIGVDLLDPGGAKLPSDINVCDNVPQVITASVSDPNLLYQWYHNGVLFLMPQPMLLLLHSRELILLK
jgi:hypothetical protein